MFEETHAIRGHNLIIMRLCYNFCFINLVMSVNSTKQQLKDSIMFL